MSLGKIDRIIDAMRNERYRFKPVMRVYIIRKRAPRSVADLLFEFCEPVERRARRARYRRAG